MTDLNKNEVTPDVLMERFQGKGLRTIIVFTIVVHLVIIGVTSGPYVWRTLFGSDTRTMSQEERVRAAVEDATAAIRKIAGRYEVNPQEISDRFSRGGARTIAPPDAAAESAAGEQAAEASVAERPVSEIENRLQERADGPSIPSIDADLF